MASRMMLSPFAKGLLVLNGWSRRSWASAGLALAALVAGGVLVAREVTSPVFALEQGPLADTPECARIAGNYPSSLAGNERDRVSYEGLAAWGRGAVELRCGLYPPAPTTDMCVTVDGVDWVLEEAQSRDGRKYLVTYGRRPAVEVSISDDVPETDVVLVEMSRLVAPVKQNARCIAPDA
ncbi:DUF3515 family protein [Streptomyces sp. NPDC057950]|uniref:DUF3515 family protein n=1 Tax=Streptomyces sp. NPDC057950 TaxID=3346288 RepID=UPI0036E4107D